jgi:hypothetical protein
MDKLDIALYKIPLSIKKWVVLIRQ